jgi:hypothetical protein
MSNSSQTGFTSISAKFDTTGIENPFYESSSKGDSLIEQMKNNSLLVKEVEINVRETEKQKQKITPGSYLNSSAKKRYEAALCKFYYRNMEINEIEKQITEDALNHYWHYVMDMLAKNSLGDIQRANLELDKKRLNEILERFRQPCT